ncbi:MAG: YaaR family protein [Defluviitaleaceae bacterium]|nr:YaaR family protein [Defluviitaleaceae bacterium]
MELKITELLTAKFQEALKVKDKVQSGFNFSLTLNKLDEEQLRHRLHGMIDNITVQGKKIADHMDIGDLRQYRAMIAEFINEVVTNSHKFSRDNFLDKRGRHRVYGIVKLVDKNLDELAQELLKTEKDHIKILDRMGDIRGLLLDIAI